MADGRVRGHPSGKVASNGWSQMFPTVAPGWQDRLKQTTLASILRDAADAYTAPARAYRGELDPMSDDAVKNMADLAGMVTLGAGAVPAERNALRAGMSAPPKKGVKAYHGSPHDFDKFSMDKIGTGEGAQAYGHGLYFADNEGVARSYRDNLLDARIPVVNSRIKELAKEMDGISSGYRNWKAGKAEIGKKLAAEYDSLMDSRTGMKGRMYEVNINANPDDFLDWDKKLIDQPGIAQRLGVRTRSLDEINDDVDLLFKQHGDYTQMPPEAKAKIEALQAEMDMDPGTMTGEQFYSGSRDEMSHLMRTLSGDRFTAEQTQELAKKGIPGIKYLDQGSRYNPSVLPDNPIANEARKFLDQSGGDGPSAMKAFYASNPHERFATIEREEIEKVIKAAAKPLSRNYVVFDENLIEIVRKYGVAGALAAGLLTQEQAKQFMQQQGPSQGEWEAAYRAGNAT
jgi:hypothetical protein